MAPETPFSSLLQTSWLDNLSTLHQLQFRARLTDQQAATVCGVSLRTWRRWHKEGSASPAVLRLMAILAGHTYPGLAGMDGKCTVVVFSPPGYNRDGFSPGHILAMHFERQRLADLKRQNAGLRRENQLLTKANRALAEASDSVPPAAPNFKHHLVKR